MNLNFSESEPKNVTTLLIFFSGSAPNMVPAWDWGYGVLLICRPYLAFKKF